MQQRYEHKVETPSTLYGDPITSSGIDDAGEHDYITQREEEGWELCGPPITPNMGKSYTYYWKRPIIDSTNK